MIQQTSSLPRAPGSPEQHGAPGPHCAPTGLTVKTPSCSRRQGPVSTHPGTQPTASRASLLGPQGRETWTCPARPCPLGPGEKERTAISRWPAARAASCAASDMAGSLLDGECDHSKQNTHTHTPPPAPGSGNEEVGELRETELGRGGDERGGVFRE